MPKERLEQVLQILSKYDSSQNVVDYYQLFNFNKSMTIDEIKTQIKQKRLQVLFHPDQIGFVPTEYHQKYLDMIEVVKDVINTFDSFKSKEVYDKKLDEYKNNISKSNCKQNSSYNENDYNKNSNYKQSNNSSYESEDLDEINFQKAIIITAKKYSFEHTYQSILDILYRNDVCGFTRDGNAREMVANIDKAKLIKIIIQSSINDDPKIVNNYEQMLMNYLTDFIYNTQNLRQQADYLEQACIATIVKYDMNGHYGQTNKALNRFYNIGDANGFTNTSNSRINLINNVDYKNTKFFMQCSLNRKRHEDCRFAYKNTEQLGINGIITMYSEELINNINNQYNSEYNGGYGR